MALCPIKVTQHFFNMSDNGRLSSLAKKALYDVSDVDYPAVLRKCALIIQVCSKGKVVVLFSPQWPSR